MAEAANKLPVKPTGSETQNKTAAVPPWAPFEGLRREINRVFADFNDSSWNRPFRPSFEIAPFWREERLGAVPAMDVVEKEKAYEVTAELPGMDDKDVEVTVTNGILIITGEKQEEKEQKRRDYYLHERHFGSFERRLSVPEGVDANKIEASFKKGVLTVTLPKTADAQKPEKKIAIKAA